MSDIKLYNIKQKRIIKKVNVIEAKQIIEQALMGVFQMRLIRKDYYIDNNTNDAISYLCLDENMQIVVIEYRYGKFGSLTNKGLLYLDYIKEHKSEFKMLFNDYEKDLAEKVNYHARLLILCDDVNSYDYYAIKKLPYTIELIQMHFYDDYVAFEKIYQSRNIDHEAIDTNMFKSDLYKYISDYLLSLGDEVIETGVNSYLIYRKINTFAYLFFNNYWHLKLLKGNYYIDYEIKNIDDFEKITKDIEDAYDAS